MGSDILKKAVVCDILHAIFSQNSPKSLFYGLELNETLTLFSTGFSMPSVLMGSDTLKKAVVCDILHAIFSQNSPSLCLQDLNSMRPV